MRMKWNQYQLKKQILSFGLKLIYLHTPIYIHFYISDSDKKSLSLLWYTIRQQNQWPSHFISPPPEILIDGFIRGNLTDGQNNFSIFLPYRLESRKHMQMYERIKTLLIPLIEMIYKWDDDENHNCPSWIFASWGLFPKRSFKHWPIWKWWMRILLSCAISACFPFILVSSCHYVSACRTGSCSIHCIYQVDYIAFIFLLKLINLSL